MRARTFWFLLFCLALVNLAARWRFGYTPVDRAEWFAHYFFQPLGFGLIGVAICAAYRRLRSRTTPFPYRAILITVTAMFALILLNPRNYG